MRNYEFSTPIGNVVFVIGNVEPLSNCANVSFFAEQPAFTLEELNEKFKKANAFGMGLYTSLGFNDIPEYAMANKFLREYGYSERFIGCLENRSYINPNSQIIIPEGFNREKLVAAFSSLELLLYHFGKILFIVEEKYAKSVKEFMAKNFPGAGYKIVSE